MDGGLLVTVVDDANTAGDAAVEQGEEMATAEGEEIRGSEPLQRVGEQPAGVVGKTNVGLPALPQGGGTERVSGIVSQASLSLVRHAVAAEFWCRGRDLNPYGLAATSPSSWRVYLFHHLGWGTPRQRR